jgi:hypothetical protein
MYQHAHSILIFETDSLIFIKGFEDGITPKLVAGIL